MIDTARLLRGAWPYAGAAFVAIGATAVAFLIALALLASLP